jgi:hypothetical protein
MGVQTFWSEFWQGIQAGIVEKLNTVRRVRGLPPVKHRNCTPRTTPKSMKYCHGRTVNKNPRVMERVMECRLDKSHEKWTSCIDRSVQTIVSYRSRTIRICPTLLGY